MTHKDFLNFFLLIICAFHIMYVYPIHFPVCIHPLPLQPPSPKIK